jgi:hypothetical protein
LQLRDGEGGREEAEEGEEEEGRGDTKPLHEKVMFNENIFGFFVYNFMLICKPYNEGTVILYVANEKENAKPCQKV